ncbi:hypothetical protein WJX74_000563 [Apatococcus lobatus]|uniref:Ubiquitin carboxyl-terminal hydrolase n=2 Tax=Apatococcus TaxID=904362 RepID=A0AAW1SR30_9CHLO
MKVVIKWGKKTFDDVEIDTSLPASIFKHQVYSLTGVPPERQKIMVKGGMLKDESTWSDTGVKSGQKLMLLGTADKLPEAPTSAPTFLEDLPEEQQSAADTKQFGSGLNNLGNTCYMNSTLQCLYSVPELRQALQVYSEPGQLASSSSHHRLAIAAQGLFGEMARSGAPVTPFTFLFTLRQAYPQFAQQGRGGQYSQQDAEECWSQLMTTLQDRLKDPSSAASDPAIKQLFGVGYHTELKCEETGETFQEDTTALSLKCNISIDVNQLEEGIKLALKDDREKNSDALGGLAVFAGSSVISHLPPYLTVHMVRFFYKADVQQKAKILRKVVFPVLLDLYDFCTPDLKRQLDGPRDALRAIEDKAAADARASKSKVPKEEGSKAANVETAQLMDTPQAKTVGDADVDMRDAGPPTSSSAGDEASTSTSAAHAGGHTGRYELMAVLTHKGRSADSGHYVSWVKQDSGQWVQFDDEQLVLRKEDEIATLAGGGDWHMAYLLMYRAQRVPNA